MYAVDLRVFFALLIMFDGYICACCTCNTFILFFHYNHLFYLQDSDTKAMHDIINRLLLSHQYAYDMNVIMQKSFDYW